MIAEVISIGDEITSGQRLDTNSQWLSERLGDLGVRVMFHTTVADDLDANVHVFRLALERADIIVATGGLGPTADDLTRQALAVSTNTDLVLDEAALEHIRRLFAHRKREMPPANQVQALFPHGSRVLPNPHGTAPGIDLDVPRTARAPARIFCLPGVPAEMREMWTATVGPAIEAANPRRQAIRHRRIKCFGVGESDLELMLPDLIRRGRSPQVGITVSQATITLRVTAEGETPQACYQTMEPTIATIRECLGDLIFGEEDDELQHVVVRLLAERKQTLTTIECGTRGMLAHWLGDAAVGTNTYVGGSVQSDSTLARPPAPMFAGRDPTTIDPRQFVLDLATNQRVAFPADFALAIGPVPNNDVPGAPRGDVHLALLGPTGIQHKSYTYAGHPDILPARTAKQALNLLRLTLLGRPVA